ncbi:hypothetical protein C8F01DRAFT_1232477 [Mycena amicta]|nr:hypothetical protein C8F01DRAFT_1232477 [Mycena amicta]
MSDATKPTLCLLDLPPELILRALIHLPLDDLASCLHSGNRTLAGIISDSFTIRYRTEQELAGVEENNRALKTLTTSERLDTLRAREERWRSFRPSARYNIPFPKPSHMFSYAIDSGLWMLADIEDTFTELSTTIQYARLTAQPSEWHTVFTGLPFANFSTALEEQDLLVVCSCVPCSDDPSLVSVEVHLLCFSTGIPHPSATQPVIFLERRRANIVIDVNLEVVGHVMVISCHDWDQLEQGNAHVLYVFNWRKGLLLMDPVFNVTDAMVFLAATVLMIFRPSHNNLEIYHLPGAESDGTHNPPNPLSLCLPKLSQDRSILPMRVHCQVSPNPRTEVSSPHYQQAAFAPPPKDAIVFLSYQTAFRGNADALPEEHRFVILPAPLLTLVSEAETRSIPWSDWGAKCTRWLDPHLTSPAWIKSTCGQRMISFPPYDPRERTAHAIALLDFNPRQVSRVRRGHDGDVDASGKTTITRVVKAGAPSDRLLESCFTHFAEPVSSDIAYVEQTSKEKFDFDNVYLSEECIVGMRYAPDDYAVDTLEVLYFG